MQQNGTKLDRLVGKGMASGTKKQAMHIKRFDPMNPQTQALVVAKDDEASMKKKEFDRGRNEI